MDRSQFRRFLLLYVVLAVSSCAASFAPLGVSDALADAYAAEPEPWLLQQRWFVLGFGIPWSLASLVGLVGLFLFRPWGRTLSLVTSMLFVPVIMISGPSLVSPVADALNHAATLAWAALLTMSYLPPVSDLFRPREETRASSATQHAGA